jgi:hypothetical protein
VLQHFGPCNPIGSNSGKLHWAHAVISLRVSRQCGPMQSYRQGSVHSMRAHVRMSFGSCAATFRPLQSLRQQLRWAHAAISPRDPGHTMRAHKRVSFLSSAATFGPLQSHRQRPQWARMGPCNHIVRGLCTQRGPLGPLQPKHMLCKVIL